MHKLTCFMTNKVALTQAVKHHLPACALFNFFGNVPGVWVLQKHNAQHAYTAGLNATTEAQIKIIFEFHWPVSTSPKQPVNGPELASEALWDLVMFKKHLDAERIEFSWAFRPLLHCFFHLCLWRAIGEYLWTSSNFQTTLKRKWR